MRMSNFRRSECGAALVEFAIVLPVLILLVFGIVDFGRLLYTLNNLTSAVREGARLAAVQPVGTSLQGVVQPRVSSYVTSFGGSSSVTVNVTPATTQATTQFITVQIVSYPFTFLTPLPALAGLRSITMSPSATFRWERAP